MIKELDQKALLELLKKDITIGFPVSKLTEEFETSFKLSDENVTFTGNSLNNVITVSEPLFDSYPLNEEGLSKAVNDLWKWLEDFEKSISC